MLVGWSYQISMQSLNGAQSVDRRARLKGGDASLFFRMWFHRVNSGSPQQFASRNYRATAKRYQAPHTIDGWHTRTYGKSASMFFSEVLH